MDVEQLIEKHRPRKPDGPASGGTLRHLNMHGLLCSALEAQAEKDDKSLDEVVVTAQTAWEVLADAQRAGLRFNEQEER